MSLVRAHPYGQLQAEQQLCNQLGSSSDGVCIYTQFYGRMVLLLCPTV
jgi:hypothetical protein